MNSYNFFNLHLFSKTQITFDNSDDSFIKAALERLTQRDEKCGKAVSKAVGFSSMASLLSSDTLNSFDDENEDFDESNKSYELEHSRAHKDNSNGCTAADIGILNSNSVSNSCKDRGHVGSTSLISTSSNNRIVEKRRPVYMATQLDDLESTGARTARCGSY